MPLFPHHFSSFLSSFLSLTPSPLPTGEVSSGNSACFYSYFFSFLSFFYHLHPPPYKQGECHLGILPLFPHHFFVLDIFSIIHTFLLLNRRSVIQNFFVSCILLRRRCNLGECSIFFCWTVISLSCSWDDSFLLFCTLSKLI